MKLIKNSIYALSMMSVMGLWSCSNDEMLPGGSDLQGHPVTLTLTVNRGDAQTRTELSENTQTGGLNDVWESGDKLTVYNADGVKAGELIIGEGVGTDTGIFTGEVTATDGQHDFNLWYTDPEATGNVEADGKPIYFNSKKEIVVDLSKMPKYTSVKALSAMDILSKGVKLNIKDNNATVVENTTMQAHMAMARFSLSGLPSGKTGTLTISDKEGQVNSDGQHQTLYKQRLSLATSGQEGTVSRPEGIKVEEVKTDEDIYLAFIPGTYTLSFNIDCDGVNYSYAFENSTEIEAGKYYSTEITLVSEEESGVVDHSKNPLAKWAESDLKRSGSGASVKGVFTGNYKTSGYYYQFGRNYGHQNYSNVLTNYGKMGVAKLNSSWTGGYFNTTEYGRVNGTSLSNVYIGNGSTNTAKWYTSTTDLSNYPEYFLFAGNSSLGNWSGELLFDTSLRNKHSWSERAEFYGYTSELCPEDYRIPTLEDWRKILPKGGHVYSTGTTSNFATFSEIKEDGDVKYAVRWSRVTEGTSTQYLKIDALVVASSVETTAGIDWTDKNVVTRYFKAAGLIKPSFFLAKLVSYNVTSYQWIAQPMPQCAFNYSPYVVNSYTGATVAKVDILRDDNWLSGFYWVDDPNQYYVEFRFDASNYQQQGSYINALSPEVPIACNIRCIHK